MQFIPDRAAALARLADFLPRAGRAYADSRNFDDGSPESGARKNVSQLSPWLHAGILSEAEVIDAVLGRHSPQAADKFIAEVFWRVYFKGYLEQRPSIWRAYCEQRDAALGELDSNAGLRTAYSQAVEGRTGIEAFDHWARELVETGYLHNHARMWFASIWIFTLKLDWTLGADFFLRQLMDGDAASNTLSWRWMGGLHTKGKTYLATPGNIARYTANMPGGSLTADGLADEAPALSEDEEHGRQPLDLPPEPRAAVFEEPYALLLHDEAASHVPLDLPEPPALVIGAARPEARSPGATGERARDFARAAVENGAAEAAKAFECDMRLWDAGHSLSDILAEAGLGRVVMPYIPTGWTRDALIPELSPLLEQGDTVVLLDDLNRATWPFAKAGFFGVKKKIESLLGEVGIVGSGLDGAG
ncbi:FAD-binding domain-containing protein [Erythrobacter sp. GH1-10]|uniref:FAD-binding domain-containing protein n=1 Tax=Erythrobacter sp. GH1-10 TaxID=3349334 RepID=UPI003877F705